MPSEEDLRLAERIEKALSKGGLALSKSANTPLNVGKTPALVLAQILNWPEPKEFVVAGNREQFLHWIRSNNLKRSDYQYLGSPEGCEGLSRDVEFIKVGDYWYSRAWKYLIDHGLIRG